jgi:hypothetical protein
MIDDLSKPGFRREIADPLKIAYLGIEITVAGGFEKIAWDGASNQIPSSPLIAGQLAFPDLVRLVHRAHECGLETYVSAGLKPLHMRPAVYAGVGGTGIGTSLHYSDPETKLMGNFDLEAIREALAIRDAAAASPRGLAAKWLAWMDRLYFEGVLVEKLVLLRKKLLQAIVAAGDADGNDADASALSQLAMLVHEIAGHAGQQKISPPGSPDPAHGQSRIVRRAQRLLRTRGLKTVGAAAMTEPRWEEHLDAVNDLLERRDEAALTDYFHR